MDEFKISFTRMLTYVESVYKYHQVCDLDDTGYTLPQMRALMMLGHKAMLAAEREGKPMPEKVKKVYVKAKKYKTGKGRQPKK